MEYLLLSIAFSVSVSILLKISRSKHIDIEQAVAVNYIVAVILGILLLKPDFSHTETLLHHWWLFGLLGVLLPSVFVIMGKAVLHAGIIKSDAAQRLSLFLPIIAAFAIFGETLQPNKLAGLVLAFIALLFLLWKPEKAAKQMGSMWLQAALLLCVWLGYGVIDILFKQLSKTGSSFNEILIASFALSGCLIFIYLFFKRIKWTAAGILGGMVLGALNFGNILFYLYAHRAMSNNPTLVFAGMNIGVIVCGTLVGSVIFKEKINQINAAGIAVAICAIVCLFYWSEIARVFG